LPVKPTGFAGRTNRLLFLFEYLPAKPTGFAGETNRLISPTFFLSLQRHSKSHNKFKKNRHFLKVFCHTFLMIFLIIAGETNLTPTGWFYRQKEH
jgi:hypothetical protein